jgi:hypothetical protein
MFREPIDEPEMERTEGGSLFALPSDLQKLIEHLYSLQRQYGIIVSVITRGDVEDAWQQDFFADGKDAPPFTDEMWDKFQDTYAWRKGLAEVMWDGVWEGIQDGLRDISDPSFGRIA